MFKNSLVSLKDQWCQASPQNVSGSIQTLSPGSAWPRIHLHHLGVSLQTKRWLKSWYGFHQDSGNMQVRIRYYVVHTKRKELKGKEKSRWVHSLEYHSLKSINLDPDVLVKHRRFHHSKWLNAPVPTKGRSQWGLLQSNFVLLSQRKQRLFWNLTLGSCILRFGKRWTHVLQGYNGHFTEFC